MLEEHVSCHRSQNVQEPPGFFFSFVREFHPALLIISAVQDFPVDTLPALCCGLMPTPSFVMMALVAAGTRNSSAANLSTAVNGAFSGTLILFRFRVRIKWSFFSA